MTALAPDDTAAKPAPTGWVTCRLGRLALVVALAGTTPATADDAKLLAYGRHLARECTSCHRLDGVDNGIPAIIGWSAADFIATLGFYRTGARPNQAMVSVAKSLDDEQMQALATYYASLPKPPASAPSKAKP